MNIDSIHTPMSGNLPILLHPSPRGCHSEEEAPLISVDLSSPRRHSAPPAYQSCTRGPDSPDTPRVVEEKDASCSNGLYDLCGKVSSLCKFMFYES